MIVNEIQLFELLKARIGGKEAEAFVQLLETKVNGKFEEVEKIFKGDVASLKEHMDKTFSTREDAAILKSEVASMKEQMDKTFSTKEDLAKLETKMSEKFNDLFKWMIIMWVTQLGAIAALLSHYR